MGVRWAGWEGCSSHPVASGQVPLSDWACVLGTEPEVEGADGEKKWGGMRGCILV